VKPGLEEWTGTPRVGLAATPPTQQPTLGLCSAWCANADVQALFGADPDRDYTPDCISASEILYELSGRRFRGSCTATDRPGAPFPGPWRWDLYQWGWSEDRATYGWWPLDGGGIFDVRDYEPFLCGSTGVVVLRGYPVIAVTAVQIGGVAVAKENFQIEDGHRLRRIDGGSWPAYQDLSKASGPGTFSVTYTHGQLPPQAGKDAAAALALEIGKARVGHEVTLPLGITRIVRAGVSFDRNTISELRQGGFKGGFGNPLVDLFLETWKIQSATVWSPDIESESPEIGGL